MSIELKIKAKTLAYEARIIRKEERAQRSYGRYLSRTMNTQQPLNANYSKYFDLRDHRVGVVRTEARATHLARAFMADKPYRLVERSTREPVKPSLIENVARMVAKYGHAEDVPNVALWFDEP